MTEQPIFRESQHFNRVFLVVLLVILLVPGTIISLYILFPDVITGVFGPAKPPPDKWALPITLIGPLIVVLVLLMRVVTEVSNSGLRVRLTPFPWKRFPLSEIGRAYVRTYRPILEYGGWGIRWGWSGRAYNARGNRGLQLELTDGKRVLIGSQQPEELLAAIRRAAPWIQGQSYGQAG
jgi:hypothetical protein